MASVDPLAHAAALRAIAAQLEADAAISHARQASGGPAAVAAGADDDR
jgi:predicted glutamine amidotransferase